MSDDTVGSDLEPGDLGEPVRELLELSVPASPGILGRVRRAIQRRLFAGEIVDLALVAPLKVMLEFLSVLFGAVAPQRDPGDNR